MNHSHEKTRIAFLLLFFLAVTNPVAAESNRAPIDDKDRAAFRALLQWHHTTRKSVDYAHQQREQIGLRILPIEEASASGWAEFLPIDIRLSTKKGIRIHSSDGPIEGSMRMEKTNGRLFRIRATFLINGVMVRFSGAFEDLSKNHPYLRGVARIEIPQRNARLVIPCVIKPVAPSEEPPVPAPDASPTPEATSTPIATPTPETTPTPIVSPTPEATPTPETSPTPEASPEPVAAPSDEAQQPGFVKLGASKNNGCRADSSTSAILVFVLFIFFWGRIRFSHSPRNSAPHS